MPNELPLPPELQHLIEKRGEADRRGSERGSGQEQQDASEALDTDLENTDGPAEQRKAVERRQAARRVMD